MILLTTEGVPHMNSIRMLVSRRYCLFFICILVLYVTKSEMMTFPKHFLHFLGSHVIPTGHCKKFAHEVFIALALFGTLQFFRLNQMFCQPLAVA